MKRICTLLAGFAFSALACVPTLSAQAPTTGPKSVFTTAAAKGEALTMTLMPYPDDDAENFWVDLNGDGVCQPETEQNLDWSKPVTLTVDAQTVTAYGNLSNFKAENCKLTALDFTANPKVANLFCRSNQLTTLALGSQPILQGLFCDKNQLTELDLTGCTSLVTLTATKNKIRNILLGETPAVPIGGFTIFENQINATSMGKLVKALPTAPDAPGLLVLLNVSSTTERNVCTKDQVAELVAKNYVVQAVQRNAFVEYKGSEPAKPHVSFKTTMKKGDKLKISIKCREEEKPNVWIDLDGNGVKDPGDTIPNYVDDQGNEVTGFQSGYTTYICGADNATVSIWGDLTRVVLLGCDVEEIDHSNLPGLLTLGILSDEVFNQPLDLSPNPLLQQLMLTYTPGVTEVDLTANPDLRFLIVPNSGIKKLDLSKNSKLERIDLEHTQVASLDPTAYPNLVDLNVSYTNVSDLDLSQNTVLSVLNAEGCGLESIDLTNNTQLTVVHLADNRLTDIKVNHLAALETLFVGKNALKTLDVSGMENLYDFRCADNLLTEIKTGNNSNVFYLEASNNQLSTINLSSFTTMAGLHLDGNKITSVSMPRTAKGTTNPLLEFWIFSNELTEDKVWAFIDQLPDKSGASSTADFMFVDFTDENEHNRATSEQVAAMRAKGWNPKIFNEDAELAGEYNSVQEAPLAAAFAVYPNPAAEVLFVTLPENAAQGDALIALYDAAGNLLRTQPVVGTGVQEFALDGLAAGTYFVRLGNRTATVVKK